VLLKLLQVIVASMSLAVRVAAGVIAVIDALLVLALRGAAELLR